MRTHIHIPPTSYVSLLLHSTAVTMANLSVFEGTMRILCDCYDRSSMHVVAAEYPQGTLIGTPTCSSHSGIALHETYLPGQEKSGCVLKLHFQLKFYHLDQGFQTCSPQADCGPEAILCCPRSHINSISEIMKPESTVLRSSAQLIHSSC